MIASLLTQGSISLWAELDEWMHPQKHLDLLHAVLTLTQMEERKVICTKKSPLSQDFS
jgi:hypothetical protein